MKIIKEVRDKDGRLVHLEAELTMKESESVRERIKRNRDTKRPAKHARQGMIESGLAS